MVLSDSTTLQRLMLLLLRCKAVRVEPRPDRRENASWSVGPQAACSASLAAGLQLTNDSSCPAGGTDGAGGAGVADPAGVQTGLCLLGCCSSSA